MQTSDDTSNFPILVFPEVTFPLQYVLRYSRFPIMVKIALCTCRPLHTVERSWYKFLNLDSGHHQNVASCLYSKNRLKIHNLLDWATEHFQLPLYGSETVFRSISHLLRHFPSSALAWWHTSSNSVTRNYCCRAREVTLSFMDTLIALTYCAALETVAISQPENGIK